MLRSSKKAALKSVPPFASTTHVGLIQVLGPAATLLGEPRVMLPQLEHTRELDHRRTSFA